MKGEHDGAGREDHHFYSKTQMKELLSAFKIQVTLELLVLLKSGLVEVLQIIEFLTPVSDNIFVFLLDLLCKRRAADFVVHIAKSAVFIAQICDNII